MYGDIPANSIGQNIGATEKKLHEKLIEANRIEQNQDVYVQLHRLRNEMSIAAKFFAEQLDLQNAKITSLEKLVKDLQEPRTGFGGIHIFQTKDRDTCAESPADTQKPDPRKTR